jgi:hypothetical protein
LWLKRSQICGILKKVKEGKNPNDQRHSKPKKTVRTGQLDTSVATAIKAHHQITIYHVADIHLTSFGTIKHILRKDLGLVKNSARWWSKWLFQKQNEERVRCTKAFIRLIQNQWKDILGKIIITDELAISLHTPESKNSP